jgi:hypothetical protein
VKVKVSNSATDGSDWSASNSGHISQGKQPLRRGLVDPGANLNLVVKRKFLTLPGIKHWFSGLWAVTLLPQISHVYNYY